MVCNVLTPIVSFVQSTLKVMPNFGSTTKWSVPPSSDGTTKVKTHEIVAMLPRCLCQDSSTSAPKRKPTEPPEDTPVDVESLDTPAPSTSRVQGAIENHIAVKWHIIALQEAMEYLLHECLTSHFSSDSLWRLRYSFSKKGTFHPDIKVSSMYLHDTRNGQHQVVNEGQLGWFLLAVISRASFRRLPPNGKSFSTMMSLHNNHFVKKRCMGKKLLLTVRAVMLQERVDMVAGRLQRRCMTPPIWQ